MFQVFFGELLEAVHASLHLHQIGYRKRENARDVR